MQLSTIFSTNLRRARETRGLNQRELGEKAGFEPSAINHFEKDRRSPSLENLLRLADALEVTTDFLLGRTSEIEAAGPTAKRILSHVAWMSESDQAAIEQMASVLAQRSKERSGV